jgi:hypothetical protein
MHCRDLVELAALVAVHGGTLVRRGRISESALEDYWTASKARLDRWTKSLKNYDQTQQTTGELTSDAALILAWRDVRPVLEEILTSEVLTRVWTGIACAYDRRNASRGIEPIARSVYGGHLEARNRALNLMVYGRGFNTQEAVELNRLRRRSERWCDMLLGYVITDQPVEEFAFEPQRTREFARDIRDELNRPVSPLGWQLVLSSLRTAFQQGMSQESPNAALNEQISAAILSCFQSELFDSTGMLQSLWMERINHVTSDTEGMLEELLSLEDVPQRIRYTVKRN